MQDKLILESSDISRLLGTVGSPLIVISELIKNAVDADATKIQIIYDNKLNQVKIIDNGIGFSAEDIKGLNKPGISRKKRNDNIRTKKGFFFTGNKGLGILSCFSLCEQILINTYYEGEGKNQVLLYKDGVIDYNPETIENNCMQGTEIILVGIEESDMELLNSETELQKLRHISTYLYEHQNVVFPEITLVIDGEEFKSIQFENDLEGMLYDVTFCYNKENSILEFLCKSEDALVNPSMVTITSFDIQSLERILQTEYGIDKIIRTRTNDTAIYSAYTNLRLVPSFNGRLFIYNNEYKANAALKQYGAGVNVYVNHFAIYNYLSSDNDWLGLADFSQRKKVTNLKPHNVYGYVNFSDFNENEEALHISNERADFLQNQTYIKLMYLLKGVVMFMIFNIDVFFRRNKTDLKVGTAKAKKNDEGEQLEIPPLTAGIDKKNSNIEEKMKGENESGKGALESCNVANINKEISKDNGKNRSGGPTPGGPSARTFFETLSWNNKLLPDNPEHEGLLIAVNELYRLSTTLCGKKKAYEVFPVSTGMILRTAYEQVLRLRLKETNLWGVFLQNISRNSFPTLKDMESFIEQPANKNTVLPQKNLRSAMSLIISYGHREFLNANIHDPASIRVTSDSLIGIAQGGMFTLIQGLINLL